MNWYKQANNMQKLINDVIEEMEWYINMGEVITVDDLIDRIKTNYRADMPDDDYRVMSNAVYEQLKNKVRE